MKNKYKKFLPSIIILLLTTPLGILCEKIALEVVWSVDNFDIIFQSFIDTFRLIGILVFIVSFFDYMNEEEKKSNLR